MHVIYQNILCITIIQYSFTARMPDCLQEQVLRVNSVNTSGIPSTNEGSDFKMEMINRQTQKWTPKVPTGHDWEVICSNHDALSELRENTFAQIGTGQSTSEHSKKTEKKHDKEEDALRSLIRQKHYLDEPLTNKTLVSLAGIELDPQLVSFSKDARTKRALYFDAKMDCEKTRCCTRLAVPFKEPPIFVTPGERKQYEADSNRTINELKVMISDKMSNISDNDVREAFEESFNDLMKTKFVKKRDFLDFLELIGEYVLNEDIYNQDNLDEHDSDDE